MNPSTVTEIDVRALAPRERHPLIFSTFAKMAEGHALVLVNDHDPKPLQASFELQVPGAYGWEYLERGPNLWRVAISKRPAGRAHSCCGSCGG